MVGRMTPTEWRERVGRPLEVARKAAGISSMRAAAKEAGFSEATWRQLESGERRPSPGVVVAPTPKITTLTAAARAVGLDPVQLAADADIYSDEDIRYAEDEHTARQRVGDRHDSVVQTMMRNAEGMIGFRTGPSPSDVVAAVEMELGGVLRDLSLRGKQRVLVYAREVQDEEFAEAGHTEGTSHSKPALLKAVRELDVAMDEALAASGGSPDPHDDQVEPATVGHPGGSDPSPEPGG